MLRTHGIPLLLAALFAAGVMSGCGDSSPGGDGPPLLDAPAPDDAPPPADVAVPADAPLVVFLGDSISAGLHLAADRAFPAVLQRRLAEDGLPFRLLNAGVSGDTTAGGLSRVDWVLAREPDVVVIELGANDGLRGVEVAAVEENLRGIVAAVRAAGARPVLLGARVPPNLGDYAERFDALFPRLAEELDVPLVPFFMDGVVTDDDLMLPDRLHPNVAGHERLAENVEPALRAALEALDAD